MNWPLAMEGAKASSTLKVMFVLSVQEITPPPILGSPVPVQVVAPMRLTPVLAVTCVDHVAEPAEMLIVSPAFALFKQVWTLFESGVVVHVGLVPVQEHHANVPL